MRVTAILTQTERKRQDRSTCRAEKPRRRARMMHVRCPSRPHSDLTRPQHTLRHMKRLIGWQSHAILPSRGTPLRECRLNTEGCRVGILEKLTATTILFTNLATWAQADVCDYRLSSLLGSKPTDGAVAGLVAADGVIASVQSSGFYLITNYTTGALMLGSTSAGTSAAGTVGIIGGASTVFGSTAAIASAPAWVIAAAAAAVGGLGMEGVCYLQDERITDFPTVYALVQQLVGNSPVNSMSLVYQPEGPWLWLRNLDGSVSSFEVLNLYVVNGELLYRDWGTNRSLGSIAVKLQD